MEAVDGGDIGEDARGDLRGDACFHQSSAENLGKEMPMMANDCTTAWTLSHLGTCYGGEGVFVGGGCHHSVSSTHFFITMVRTISWSY